MIPRPPHHLAAGEWTVVVPVKSTRRGKSRLDVDPAVRPRIALAMARDTLEAVVAASQVVGVVVVVSDAADVPALDGRRRAFVVDPVDDLNLAIEVGVGRALAQGAERVAVLPGDLPSLRPGELDEALTLAAAHPLAVVPDQDGTGTTLLAAADPARLVPAFGVDSFHRHQATGAVPLELPAESGLRRDVDEIADLAVVSGPRTLAALQDAGLLPCTPEPAR